MRDKEKHNSFFFCEFFLLNFHRIHLLILIEDFFSKYTNIGSSLFIINKIYV